MTYQYLIPASDCDFSVYSRDTQVRSQLSHDLFIAEIGDGPTNVELREPVQKWMSTNIEQGYTCNYNGSSIQITFNCSEDLTMFLLKWT